jgi:predicted acylesterase/phospholipase RssA
LLEGIPWVRPVKGFQICAAFLLSFWLLSSGVNILTQGLAVPRDPQRFAQMREKVEKEKPWGRARVGLALSGGGYRAVLMHAGVLDGLEQLGVPVSNISTVSGGSIIGSFYAIGGKPTDLRDAVKDGRFRLTRSLTDAQNLPFLGFPFQVPMMDVKLFPWYEFSRSDVQANLLDRILLDGATFAQMKEGAPELMVCSTDLRTGALFGFHRGGVLRKDVDHPSEKRIFRGLSDAEFDPRWNTFAVDAASRPKKDSDAPFLSSAPPPPTKPLTFVPTDPKWLDTPLSRVVAASGAFPGAFNAIREQLPLKSVLLKEDNIEVLLADGGITDNSALTIMEWAKSNNLEGWKELNLVLSSDASALLGEGEDLTSLGELSRAVDIVYANIGSSTWSQDTPKVLLSPAAFIDMRTLNDRSLGEKMERTLDQMLEEKKRRTWYLKWQAEKMVERSLSKQDKESLALLHAAMPEGDAKRLLKTLSDNAPSEPGGNGIPAPAPAPEGWWEMHDAVVEEVVSCSEVFMRTSTLTDNFEAGDADKLFRLGQFLVAFNWPYIKQQLTGSGRAQANVTVAAAAGGAADKQLAAAEPMPQTRPVSILRRRGARRAAAQPR